MRATIERTGGGPAVSAVLLNFRDPELTARAVGAFERAASVAGISSEVVVVDNSAPETADALRELLPEDVVLIENDANRGFAAAVNQGIRASRGETILLLNTDAFVDAPLLRRGLDHLSSHPETGIWAPSLIFEDGSHQTSCAPEPTLVGCAREYLLGLDPDRYAEERSWTQPAPVDSVTGAVMLLRRGDLDRIGLLDERFFFNCEDVDLCVRVREEGLRVVYDPGARAVHLAGASSRGRRWGEDPHLHRERVRWFRKHRGAVTALVARLVIGAGLLIRRIFRPLAPRNR